MAFEVTAVSYLAATVAFLALTVLLLLAGSRRPAGLLLLGACVFSVLWSLAAAMEGALVPPAVAAAAEVARSLAWIAFAASLVQPVLRPALTTRYLRMMVAGLGIAALAIMALNTLHAAGLISLPQAVIVSRLGLAVAGLVLIENIVRNADENLLWSLKFVAFALGAVFVYDLFIYADALLLNRVSEPLQQARGAINALAVPLLAVAAGRNKEWSTDIHVSRRAVFHTASVVGSGVYLVGMAAVGFYLRNVGGQWGPTLQIIFFAVAVLLMLLALSSGSSRAWLRFVISRNFFSYRYDYREEWQKFIASMSASDDRLYDRAIRAIASIVESPAGALWMRWDNERTFFPAGRWNFPENLPYVGFDSTLVRYFEQHNWIVNLSEWREDADAYDGLELPEWIVDLRRSWLIVPLQHRERLEGFLILGQPRVPHQPGWEAYDLLKTLGRQVGGYLAEEAVLRALVDAQQLQDFNRRFAFVVHDIKNVTGQLSLILSNANKHWDNPEFQKDAMNTVRNSVEKMGNLLGQLRQEPATQQRENRPLSLAPLLRQVLAPWQTGAPAVVLQPNGHDELQAMADEEALTAVVGHLVQNAREAVGDDGAVTVRLDEQDRMAVIEVIDDGPGMDATFIRDQLFRPLRTTKGSGYGIGAYQTRELVRTMGGRLEVLSQPGSGTTMRVLLRQRDDDGGVDERAPAEMAERG
ncbi:MAG: PEP-CTERM system histidine kinase PrsK [Alphaproteobacteria bacterium]